MQVSILAIYSYTLVTHTHTHTHTHTQAYPFLYYLKLIYMLCMYTCICVHTYTCMSVHTYSCMNVYTPTLIYTLSVLPRMVAESHVLYSDGAKVQSKCEISECKLGM